MLPSGARPALAALVLLVAAASAPAATDPLRFSSDGTYLIGLNFPNEFKDGETITLEEKLGDLPLVRTTLSVDSLTHRECDGRPGERMLEIRRRLTPAGFRAGISTRLVAADGRASGAACMVIYEVPKPVVPSRRRGG